MCAHIYVCVLLCVYVHMGVGVTSVTNAVDYRACVCVCARVHVLTSTNAVDYSVCVFVCV